MLVSRNAPPGCVVLAITNHPRHPGEEIEQIFPLTSTETEDGSTLYGTVDVSHVGAFPAKQVIGPYTETSHQILSSASQNTWAGGGQIDEAAESEDTDRFSGLATLETRFPRHLMLLPLTVSVAGPNATGPRVLGDFFHTGAMHTYVAYGTALRELAGTFPDTLSLTGALTLTDAPVAPGVVFPIAGVRNLYIPQGAGNGYQTFNGAAVAAQVAAPEAIWFMVHSNKLWALDAAGVLWKSLDGTTWIQAITLDPGVTPRGVIAYPDRADFPAPHLITDAGVYAMDDSVPAIYETSLTYAPHPYAGTAFETWREDLYVGIGLGVQRYTGSTVNAAGLDRDDGPGIRAYCSTLRGAFNDLFAGFSPVAQAGGVLETVFVDQGLEVYIGSQQDRAYVMRLPGSQSWHTLWAAPTAGGTIRDLHVSAANSDYRVMWGWGGLLWVSRLTTDFDNPKTVPDAMFDPGPGVLTSSWLDMNLTSDRMTLAALETRAHEDAAPGDDYTLDYQIDEDDITDTWHTLGTINTPGLHQLRLGANGTFPTSQSPNLRFDGVGFSRFRYRVTMRRHAEHRTHSPACRSITEVYRARMRRVRNFAFVVDCITPEHDGAYGLGNAERRTVLKQLIESEPFIPFLYQDEWIMIQIPYGQGPEGTGLDKRGNVNVNALEAWEQETP